MKYLKIVFILLFINFSFSQVNPLDVEIVRDNYGVPHIYGKTDADVAYGLAWSHAEDDFKTIQQGYLAGNGLLSKHIGIKGAGADFLTQLIESKKTVEELFDTLDADFVKIIEAYSQGLNKYAELNPEEVLEKKLFPITPKKMTAYSFLQLFIANEADKLVISIINNNVPRENPFKDDIKGSNTFAFNSFKTGTDETYLAINTHQPLDGPTSWYEAHLVSEEGTNIIGATFAGAPCILIGANENLGWAHTVNYPDKADIFELEMHPTKKLTYLVDGEEIKLEKKKASIYINILGIDIKVKRKYYKSIFGPTLKNKSGFFSVRTPTLFNIKALQQWWQMNKANSFDEFYEILKKRNLPGYNIGYADKEGNIFYISNGIIPKRNEDYNWRNVVPGNTRKNLWTEYYSIEELQGLPIDDMVDLDNEAQIELANKQSLSKLRSEYLEAMEKWKSACKDLKLGGYKCEVDNHPAYTKWQGMLNRAYGASSGKWYDNVTVSESFKHYPIFKQWYLTQYLEEGWELDKDLLVKGNKVYCASRCCFLPKEINSALAINRSLIPMLAEKYRKVLNNDIYKALL